MAATQIVILGGGFAGVYTAMYLEKKLKPGEADIHLVSRDNYLVFSPMLPEVISGSIEILHAITPIRGLCHRTLLHTREVESIDLDNREIVTSPGIRQVPHKIRYDHLILGLGTQLSFAGMPGVEQHGIPFKNLGDALYIRNHVIHALEEADIETDPELKQQLLTFVVAGGGFAGVEGVAELNDFVREAAESYQTFKSKDIKVYLLHAEDQVLPEVKPRLRIYAQNLLQRRGVEIKFNCRLAAATASEAILNTGEKIPTRTLITTVPGAPHPLVAGLPGAKDNRGKVPVDEFLQINVPGYENVWGLGDCCLVPAPNVPPDAPPRERYSPPTAQHAIRQGKCAAANIAAKLHGQPMQKFNFGGLGKMGALGKYNAVAEMFDNMLVSGPLAWLMWRAVYLAKLPGWDRKARVALDWFVDIFIRRDLVRLRLDPSEAMHREHFEPGEYVFRQDDIGDRVYFIVAGQVEILREADGGEKRIDILDSGDLFGEMALMTDQRRNASVRALTALDVMTVSRNDLSSLITHVPGIKEGLHEVMQRHVKSGAAVAAAAGSESNPPVVEAASEANPPEVELSAESKAPGVEVGAESKAPDVEVGAAAP